MTAHKAQGQTLTSAIVDLQSCYGTEAPYVMISRVTSLDGLLILRPFDKKKIQCRQSEDSRREMRCLDILRLKSIIQHGGGTECAEARKILDKICSKDDQMDIDDSIGVDLLSSTPSTVHSSQWLEHLQATHHCITHKPIPTLANNPCSMAAPHALHPDADSHLCPTSSYPKIASGSQIVTAGEISLARENGSRKRTRKDRQVRCTKRRKLSAGKSTS